MPKYTGDEIRNMKKITCKIAGEYLGISSMAVSMERTRMRRIWTKIKYKETGTGRKLALHR